MGHRAGAGAAALLGLGLLMAGCSGDAPTPETTPAEEPDGSEEPSDSGSPSADDAGSAGGAVDELRDGTWEVGDAGEVEFALADGSLSLIEVRPAEGWQDRVSDESSDEVEVYFAQGNIEWEFEVELGAGSMEISKELEIDQAESGTYDVGSAAEVEIEIDGTTVTLVDVRPAEGWEITKRDESSDEIELDFANDDGGTAEFEAEVEVDGIELEIEQKLTGPIPE